MVRRSWILVPLLAPSVALAAVHYAEAPVVGVEPMYQTVQVNTPRQVCRDERYAVQQPAPGRSVAVPLIGAAIGGALGHTIGHEDRENNLGAAVGAILGGAVGLSIANRPGPVAGTTVYQTRQVCSTENDVRNQQELVGYRVRYRYQGETYVMDTDRQPGETVRVRVEVTPVS